MQDFDELNFAIASVPAGAWAVGVSGGADSVALLSLLRQRADLRLRAAHLDHQTRAGASATDAQFVQALTNRWEIPCDAARLDEILPSIAQPPKNRQARFRAARLALYRRVVEVHRLDGVILAHHADDQAETILLRLLRGSGYTGLAGISRRSVIGGMVILRPLLNVRRAALRGHLEAIGQEWREDESNVSTRYARNRARMALGKSSELTRFLLDLGDACFALRHWTMQMPDPPQRIPLRMLQDLPSILARQTVRRWLVGRGAQGNELSPAVLDRMIEMACDRASPRQQQFPGQITVTRRGSELVAESPH